MPPIKKRFQDSLSQLFSLRYDRFVLGEHIEHKWRKLLDMPKGLPTNNSKSGTVRPIKGPPIYQGQGSNIQSMFIFPYDIVYYSDTIIAIFYSNTFCITINKAIPAIASANIFCSFAPDSRWLRMVPSPNPKTPPRTKKPVISNARLSPAMR